MRIRKIIREKRLSITSTLVVFFSWICLMNNAFSDEIKTLEDAVIAGEVVEVTDAYLSVKQEQGQISSIPWSAISLISRNKDVVMVSHDEKQIKFSILTTTPQLSAKDMHLTVTDKITDVYPQAKIASPVVQPDAEQAKRVAQAEQQTKPVAGAPEAKAATPDAVPVPQKTWKGHVDAGMNIKQGNTESTTTHAKGGYANERKRDNIYFDALALYETITEKDADEDTETVNEQRATGKYEYKHSPRLYSFFNQNFEHDEIEQLNYRSISSPGAGYRFVDGERIKYRAEAGPAYTLEKFHGGISDDYLGVRVGQYFDWLLLRDTKFYAKNEYIQSVENSDDWRLDSGLGARHNLTKSIALSLELLNQYDNTPSEGNQKDDTIIIGSVGYNF